MIPAIDLDMIFSDPLLSVGAALLVLGPLMFLYAFWKLIRFNKTHHEFVVPHHDHEPSHSPILSSDIAGPASEITASSRSFEKPQTAAPPVRTRVNPVSSDETIIMPPGVAELQAQVEIAITQLKNLSKRVNELEMQLDKVQNEKKTDRPSPAQNPPFMPL